MPNIDPSSVVHEIPTYPGAKPIRQHLRLVHPRKTTAIKAEVEKLLKAGFIYPIPLTNWVSNIVHVTKKQGTIKINITPADQHKTAFICPWGTFSYKKLPFGLKNFGATFQRAMSYAFHDIQQIVQPYLDELPAHSVRRQDYPTHLHEIFLLCRHYRIRLNPHKCVFCVESGRLLRFIISREGIHLDPLKVEAILNLPPPASL
eukprot:PITA_26655